MTTRKNVPKIEVAVNVPKEFLNCREIHGGSEVICDGVQYDPKQGYYCTCRGLFTQKFQGYRQLMNCDDFKKHILPRWVSQGKYLLDSARN